MSDFHFRFPYIWNQNQDGMNIPFYINELLFENDCVVIPGFGGMITRMSHARVLPGKYMHFPPSRNLYFNQNIRNNDGLLAHYISSKEKLSYDLCVVKLEAFANECLSILKNKKSLDLQPLGLFTMNEEDKIIFEPSDKENYHYNSFGMNPVQAVPVRREKTIIKKREANQEKSLRKVWYYAAAATVTLLLCFAYLFIEQNSNSLIHKNQSNLNIFDTMHSKPEPAKISAPPVAVKPENAEVKVTRQADIHKSEEPAFKDFYIIAGSFSSEKRAEKFLHQLEQKGMKATLLSNPGETMIRVSLGHFHSKEEARQELPKIRESVNENSWILSM